MLITPVPVASHWNRTYINFSSPKIKVFRLNKGATSIDRVYGEESNTRIYIKPFEIRALMLTNPWKQLLGLEAFREEEDSINFTVNFDNMVQKIREMKDLHTSEMIVSYSGEGTPSASKSGSTFIIKVNNVVLATYDLSSSGYNTVQKLGSVINSALHGFSVRLVGINDSSIDLVDFNNTPFKDRALLSYSQDINYDNITDVIEVGDVILTNKWRLYEVISANPSGDFAWDWVSYTLTCNLARIDQVSLPGDYEQQIKEHQYEIKDHISME